MATETFYVKKEDVDDYKKAKELLGDGYSLFIMKSLKNFLTDIDIQSGTFASITLYEGRVSYHPDGSESYRQGQNIKFVGILLAEDDLNPGPNDPAVFFKFKLYLTRKGKFLLHRTEENCEAEKYSVETYYVKDTIEQFKDMTLPPNLLLDAEKKMPGVTCKVLDI